MVAIQRKKSCDPTDFDPLPQGLVTPSYHVSMTRDQILQAIDANRGRLSALGVLELALFGSYARGDAGPDSDVDFLVEFTEKSFDRYMELRELLEELLGRKVDLVLKGAIKLRLRERILSEAIRAA